MNEACDAIVPHPAKLARHSRRRRRAVSHPLKRVCPRAPYPGLACSNFWFDTFHLLAYGTPVLGTLRIMSTLAEIESAADALSPEEKEELLRFLAIRLRRQRPQPAPRIYSDVEFAAMLAEDEADGDQFRRTR